MSTVYKFRLLSHEIKDFVRDIEIKAGQTFFDFHMAIQDDLNFDSSQIASFFLTNQLWEKEKEFILFDLSDVPNSNMIAMDRARLRDYVKDAKQRLIYIFDIFNERGLFIELVETLEEDRYSNYPAVVFSKGQSPQQIVFGTRDLGAVIEEDNAVVSFDDDYDEDDKENLPGEMGEDEDEDGTPGEFGADEDGSSPEE
jgi:hypothetical protein